MRPAKLSDKLKGQPQEEIKEFYSALEEGRADMVALYFMADPKLDRAGPDPRRANKTSWPGPRMRTMPRTPWCSSAASATGRSSRRTTCEIARWWSAG